MAVKDGRIRVGVMAVLIVMLTANGSAQVVDPKTPHRDSVWLKLGLVASLGCQGADIWTTGLALGSGAGREGNFVVALMVNHPMLAGIFTAGTRAGLAWFLLERHKEHPTFTTALAWASAAGSCYVASRNQRIYNRRR